MNNIKYNINSYKRISNINNNFKWQTQNSLIIYNVYPKMTHIITIRFHRSSSPTSSPLFQRSKLLSSHQPSPYVLHKHLAANREYLKLNLVPTWITRIPINSARWRRWMLHARRNKPSRFERWTYRKGFARRSKGKHEGRSKEWSSKKSRLYTCACMWPRARGNTVQSSKGG